MLGRIVAYCYGSFALACAQFGAIADPTYWRKDSEEQVEQLKRANTQLWSLSASASRDKQKHSHAFVTLDSGLQLHYLHSRLRTGLSKVPTLIVFLHGFPDSSHIFTPFLDRHSSDQEIAVSLDIPGYGGSDSLASYGANAVLDAISEAMVKLKDSYLASPSSETATSQCLLVGHDWGGAIAYRIAAETVGLIDSVIIVNSTHTLHARQNITTRVKVAHQAWNQWLASPQNISPLRSAYHQLTPIVAQLVMSSYIFMFNLPFNTAKWFPSLVLHLLKWVIVKGHFREEETISPVKFAFALSSCLGPGAAECSTRLPDGTTYGKSVFERSLTNPPGDWDERIRLYREGLASSGWRVNEFNSGFLVKNEIEKHSLRAQRIPSKIDHFKCPVTVVYGLQDLALDPRIMLDGIEQFFALHESEDEGVNGQSNVVRLKDCGHWSMIEETGDSTLTAAVRWRTQRRTTNGDSNSKAPPMQDDQDLQDWLNNATSGDVQVSTG